MSGILQAVGLAKDYDGIQALRWDADSRFDAAAGEIHAVVGENGAGKSTFMAILAGLVNPSAGRITLAGADYAPSSAAESRLLGVEIVLQEPGLIGALTITENFFLGRSADTRLGYVRRRRGAALVRAALSDIAPHVSSTALASSLSLEDQKLVEIARAIHFEPKVLLVDEMSACLSRPALDKLFQTLRRLSESGTAVLYISHYLEEVKELCDRVTVFRDGRLITTLPTSEVDERQLASLMVGRDYQSSLYRDDSSANRSDRTVLAVAGLTIPGEYEDVSLEVSRGEILGIGGLIGCGSDALARTLFGAMHARSGSMTLNGEPYAPHSPRQAIARGVAYVPPDRDREGLLLRAPIGLNVTLATLPRLAKAGLYSGRGEASLVGPLIAELSIRCRSETELPLTLSGGNRQKVVLAKWLLTEPDLLILHNPTRGIDVRAKAEIYRLVDELAAKGMAIVLISDELPELIGMSDRILMMRRGAISHETIRDLAPTEDELIAYMV
ncbi:sugar ABC transporter ATP-binding protein [Agromyces bauzanensis]